MGGFEEKKGEEGGRRSWVLGLWVGKRASEDESLGAAGWSGGVGKRADEEESWGLGGEE